MLQQAKLVVRAKVFLANTRDKGKGQDHDRGQRDEARQGAVGTRGGVVPVNSCRTK